MSERPSERRVKLSGSSGERGKGDSRAHPRGRWHWDTSLPFIEEKRQVISYGQSRESPLEGKFEGVFIVAGEEKSG